MYQAEPIFIIDPNLFTQANLNSSAERLLQRESFGA